ncbi:MAG: hypothetical protein ACOZAM_08075 [Pseudomonadota bacterium]
MDEEKVYIDVVAAIRATTSTDLKKIPSEPPPEGLGAARLGAWREKLSVIVDHLKANGYRRLSLAKEDPKKTYDVSLQATAILLLKRIMGVARVSARAIEIEANLLNSLQASGAARARRRRG